MTFIKLQLTYQTNTKLWARILDYDSYEDVRKWHGKYNFLLCDLSIDTQLAIRL